MLMMVRFIPSYADFIYHHQLFVLHLYVLVLAPILFLLSAALFSPAAKVIMDRNTGKSRGFGFVNYASNESATSALSAMDGQVLNVI